jgi:hypothetical protein
MILFKTRTAPSVPSLLPDIRIGDIVTFDFRSDERIEAVYAGPNEHAPDRFDAIGPTSEFSSIGYDDIHRVLRLVDGGYRFKVDEYDEHQYSRMTAEAKVLYASLRSFYGWGHYSAYGKASHALGRVR